MMVRLGLAQCRHLEDGNVIGMVDAWMARAKAADVNVLAFPESLMTPFDSTADEVAAMNRLTVTASLKFTNRKYPEEDFEKSFQAYSDYDSTNSLDAVESSLCEEIVDKLVEDMFNASVAQW